jgi:hypothetical protein
VRHKEGVVSHLRACAIVVVMVLAWSNIGVFAQVDDAFDTSRRVTITGVFAGIVYDSPNSYLMLDAKGADGTLEAWAIQGNDVSQFKGAVKFGAPVSVTVYLLKPKAQINIPAVDAVRVMTAAKAGRIAHGIDVTLPGGRSVPFGPEK